MSVRKNAQNQRHFGKAAEYVCKQSDGAAGAGDLTWMIPAWYRSVGGADGLPFVIVIVD